ncbi:MAG: 5'/3'-nucleotidase SurE [Vulcanimicrobiota bacterium]
MYKILVTNDDGFDAPGITALALAMQELGEVTVVAPDRERSAIGHGLTFFRPLRIHQEADLEKARVFSSDGTPTDCVLLGVHAVLENTPDLVVSGINRGPNLGDDITYSGTVSAALEAAIQKIPAMAVSLSTFDSKAHYETAAHFAAKIARKILEKSLPPGEFVNVNVPNIPVYQVQGIDLTVQGKTVYKQKVISRTDPRGIKYYWLTGDLPRGGQEEGTDYQAVHDNRVSVTPLHTSMTRHESLELLNSWQIFDRKPEI